jgi:hypothetical protein
MDIRRSSFLGLVMSLLAVLSVPPLQAAQIDHHGVKADPDGPATSCLACHDGTVGRNVTYCTVQCDYRSSHSLHREYPPKRKGKNRKIDQYASLEELAAKGIRLEDGKETCISCHDLRNPAPKQLIAGKNLCRICHVAL